MESDDEHHYDEQPIFLDILKKKKQSRLDEGPKTLKDLCLSCIKLHSKFFLQVDQQTGLNPFNCILNPMKSELLGDTFGKWGRWEELLVNKQLTSVTIETGYQDEPTAYTKIWRSMCLENVQLRHLCWTSPEGYEDLIHPETLICGSSICTNLQLLTLNSFECTDLHLQMFASHLKKLRVLSLVLNGVTAHGISALSKLEHLEEFHFTWSPGNSAEGTTAYNLCLQLMPKLQVVGDDLFNAENYCSWEDVDLKFHVDFELIPKPAELGLRQLVLHHQNGDIPEGITFPNLNSLCLWDPVENFRFDARFSKVTDLGICFRQMEKYSKILTQMGHQLKKLRILQLDKSKDLPLDMIIRLCPNLEELCILQCQGEIKFWSPLEPETDLHALKTFRVNSYEYESYTLFSPGDLVQLLKAPNLRCVQLFWVSLLEEDAEAIASLVQQGRMLQKLERFDLKIDNILEREKDPCFQIYKARSAPYDLVLLNMAKYCPCFVDYEEHCEF